MSRAVVTNTGLGCIPDMMGDKLVAALITDLAAERDALTAKLAAVTADRDRYKAVLEQYANEDNWGIRWVDGHTSGIHDWWMGHYFNGYDPAQKVLKETT